MQEVELGANEVRAKSAGPNGLMGSRSPIVELVLRSFVSILTVISLSLIASDIGFSTVPAFNYLLGTTVLSFLYCFFESVIACCQVASSGRPLLPITFHTNLMVAADLICSILLLSGSSAAFGVTTENIDGGNFNAQAIGSAILAFFCISCHAAVGCAFMSKVLHCCLATRSRENISRRAKPVHPH